MDFLFIICFRSGQIVAELESGVGIKAGLVLSSRPHESNVAKMSLLGNVLKYYALAEKCMINSRWRFNYNLWYSGPKTHSKLDKN